MPYSSALAATLSGATLRQLGYWRRDRQDGPLLKPEFGSRPRVQYSYQDIVALRMFVKLRGQTSLQRVRRAVNWLQERHPDTHLSGHALAATPGGKSIIWFSTDGDYFDIVQQPGQQGITVVMEDLFDSFETKTGRFVPNLRVPEHGLSVDPNVRGGYPVISGTRIPYNLVAGLAADGLSSGEIGSLYPRVSARDVEGATRFALLVERAMGATLAA